MVTLRPLGRYRPSLSVAIEREMEIENSDRAFHEAPPGRPPLVLSKWHSYLENINLLFWFGPWANRHPPGSTGTLDSRNPGPFGRPGARITRPPSVRSFHQVPGGWGHRFKRRPVSKSPRPGSSSATGLVSSPSSDPPARMCRMVSGCRSAPHRARPSTIAVPS
jgi:hypothetical protein